MPDSLMQLVKRPWQQHRSNSTIAFCDNSSALRGFPTVTLLSSASASASASASGDQTRGAGAAAMHEQKVDYDLTFTAETHNFPSGVAPFPGAETGTGGRIRDGHATGQSVPNECATL